MPDPGTVPRKRGRMVTLAYLRSVCEVAEKGVKTIATVAFTSAMPIFQKLEPQIAFANNYARIGLDEIEEKLPILHLPADEHLGFLISVILCILIHGFFYSQSFQESSSQQDDTPASTAWPTQHMKIKEILSPFCSLSWLF
ncbi:perilipin-5-like [Latimeria chalumnae]|uniref:perilipin-5-like n=1 Tax=Latimeria chalumnae TaxID=7897 RepID=UPI00313C8EC8